ncbi:MAG: helix-turn-helix domain-containing protein [Nitrospira sp.]
MAVETRSIRIVSSPHEGDDLATIPKRLGLTQGMMARGIGVAKDTVARWECNELAIREPMYHLIRSLESRNNR